MAVTSNDYVKVEQVPKSQTEYEYSIPAKTSYFRMKSVGGAATIKAVSSGTAYTMKQDLPIELIAGHHQMPTVLAGIKFLFTTDGSTTVDILCILGNID
jgi:hypothetical protein